MFGDRSRATIAKNVDDLGSRFIRVIRAGWLEACRTSREDAMVHA
jgi:hypothetical protein